MYTRKHSSGAVPTIPFKHCTGASIKAQLNHKPSAKYTSWEWILPINEYKIVWAITCEKPFVKSIWFCWLNFLPWLLWYTVYRTCCYYAPLGTNSLLVRLLNHDLPGVCSWGQLLLRLVWGMSPSCWYVHWRGVAIGGRRYMKAIFKTITDYTKNKLLSCVHWIPYARK